MRARSADVFALRLLPGDALTGPATVPIPAGVPDGPGWGLRVDAEDALTVARPVTLVYGIGYEEEVSGAEPGLFVQRAGVVWSRADLRLDVRLTRHALVASDPAPAPRLSDPMGWSAALEVPLPAAMRVRAEALSSPVHDDALYRDLDGILLQRPVYLTGGTASTRQTRVMLRREAQRTNAFVQVVAGTSEGRLARVDPAALSAGGLDERRLDFLLSRAGLRVVPTGTDLIAEYRRVVSDPVSAEQEYVELRIAQDLSRLRSRGASWRLLLAARATQDGADGPGEGTQHWMGAGISVAF